MALKRIPTLTSPDQAISSESVGESEGDFRGRYGFGRPAHGSDSHASYAFGEVQLPTVRTKNESGGTSEAHTPAHGT